MSTTSFLSNDALWQATSARVRYANRVDAAIAYFGQGGAKLLPLSRGHRLVVDMSPGTVRAGSTDPREIEKLIRRGVCVFTRRNLHAKTVVADRAVISGSNNISKNSLQVLDEAAILTTEPSAVRRAREFIDRLCTDPISDKYLQACKRIYKPPRFNSQFVSENGQQWRARHATLWLVSLHESPVPEPETDRYGKGAAKAEKQIKDDTRFAADSFHWPSKPKMANELELGDWIIEVVRCEDKSILVYPPGKFLFADHYIRDRKRGKERWVFHLEVPRRPQTQTWREFRRAAGSLLGAALSSPRTKAIRDIDTADNLRDLWTDRG